jgi:hypothetical protein
MTAANTQADVMAVIDKVVKSPERKSANKVVATMKAFGGDSVDGLLTLNTARWPPAASQPAWD